MQEALSSGFEPTGPVRVADATSPTSEEKTWAMLCHVASVGALILPAFGNILGPLIVWLIKKDRSPFVDAHGRAALDFQITVSIAATVLAMVTFIAIIGAIFIVPLILFPIVWLLGLAILIIVVIAVIQGATAANRGEPYTYRFAIRMFAQPVQT